MRVVFSPFGAKYYLRRSRVVKDCFLYQPVETDRHLVAVARLLAVDGHDERRPSFNQLGREARDERPSLTDRFRTRDVRVGNDTARDVNAAS